MRRMTDELSGLSDAARNCLDDPTLSTALMRGPEPTGGTQAQQT